MENPSHGMAAGTIDAAALAAFQEVSEALIRMDDLDDILQAVARATADILSAEGSSVILVDRSRNKLVFRAATGITAKRLLGQEFDADLGIAGRVLMSGEPEVVNNAHEHPGFFSGFDNDNKFDTRTLIAVPLCYRDGLLGVLEVLNKDGDTGFTPHDVEVLQVFAGLAATGVANAQLARRLEREGEGHSQMVAADNPIIGESPALSSVLALCDRVAETHATVLLLGETGTGKELSARRIHASSPRCRKPFIAINCAALPETLLESELFGHEEGAFTGATNTKLGRFELADGGTLFLDEIGDISQSTQIKLLRILQEREFVRVGGVKTITCDVRIIAATNRDLQRAMEEGVFREDLFYRLNVFPIKLPPLRERADDVCMLVQHFVRRSAAEHAAPVPEVTNDAQQLLCKYRWPGNIRELCNVIERAVLLCDTGVITAADLPHEIIGAPAEDDEEQGDAGLEGYEKAMIVKALEETDWNQTRAAEVLGISRDNLRYRLRKYQIKRAEGG